MSIPQALRISRQTRDLSQGNIDVPYSQQMISGIEKGERKVARDMAPKFAEALDHPAMFFELSRELTGGFGPAWLDGPNVDLHRACVREKALEELDEAIEAINKFRCSKPPGAEVERDKHARYDHLIQCFDAVVALMTYIGVQCLEYGFSMLKLSRDHYTKMRNKRYVQT